jgi:L-lactate dehydrogenase complex protein LldE
MRIGVFVTCLTDTLYPGTGRAVVAVLERLGHQVDFPAAQSCCGQMHFNTGYRREATPMARGFTAAFSGYEATVTPSASGQQVCAFAVSATAHSCAYRSP